MDISSKTNRVLHFISLCLILILIRTWYLGVVQHDFHVQQSKKPQRRVMIEKADRAAIYDRFGVPLAINKIQYNAAICYANIRQIPSTMWEKNTEGKRVRVAARTQYINQLAQMLSSELGVDITRVEDIIHGKAALLPHTPFVIKEDISEEQYYRLRMLEKDWLGLQAQRTSRRTYPLGKVACDVIGYLGTMDQTQYFRIAQELQTLEEYLMARERNENPFLPEGFNTPEEVHARFLELQEKAYTMNDLVGKNGIEAFYEEELRGYCGKRIYEIDIKGNRLQELPGSRKALSGKKVTLTISSELQDFSEKLLASIEGSRLEGGMLDENWMRGGAVVAMLPKTGEIVALASYPRFNPNDFIPNHDPFVKKEKEFAVRKWLENEGYIGAIWDGRRPVEREYFSFTEGRYIEEKMMLGWDRYLQAILPAKGPLVNIMHRITDLHLAVQIQEAGIFHPLLREIPSEDDRLLVLDLCHLVAPKELFQPETLSLMGSVTLIEHHANRQLAMQILSQIKEEIQELFFDYDFTAWRTLHFKEHLKQKRQEEKENKKYARPYTDYLDNAQRKLFQAFWDTHKSIFLYTALTGKMPILIENYPHLRPYFAFLKTFPPTDSPLHQKLKDLSTSLGVAYLMTFRSFEDLTEPLQNHYPNLRFLKGKQLEKHLAAAFYPLYGYGFSRSQAFRQTSPQGSVFKLITSYQVMLDRYQQHKDLNPLSIIDDLKGNPFSNSPTQVLGYTNEGTPLYRSYKGGRLPRSSHGGMGRVDLVGALEQSSNLYFALLVSDYLQDPMSLARAATAFGFGQKTGVELPNEAKGNVPDDLAQNRSGLYVFAIGQHALEVTPLQTAVALSGIANQGAIVKPHVVKQIDGLERGMQSIVYHTPVEIERTLPFPDEIFKLLTEGMRQVVTGARGSARPSIMRNLYDHPLALRTYRDVHQDLLAKTGTAQVRYKQSISKSAPAAMKHHVWFSAIAYPQHHLLSAHLPNEPELVVVVYLRYRQSGREGGTIAGQVVNKWREIKAKNQSN